MLRTPFVVVVAVVALLSSCEKEGAPKEGEWRAAGIDAGVFGGFPLTEQGKAHQAEMDKRKLEKLQLGFVREPEQKCVADADCVLTPRFCCGCTANGAMVGVHKDKLQELLYRRVVACKEHLCPQVMSSDPSCEAKRAVCRGGVCVADAPPAKKSDGVGVEPIRDEAPAQPSPAPTPAQPG
jgi:hypothetical protein